MSNIQERITRDEFEFMRRHGSPLPAYAPNVPDTDAAELQLAAGTERGISDVCRRSLGLPELEPDTALLERALREKNRQDLEHLRQQRETLDYKIDTEIRELVDEAIADLERILW